MSLISSARNHRKIHQVNHCQIKPQYMFSVLWISPNSWVAHQTTHGGKLGRPNHCLLARIILIYLLKTFFLVINTKFACFLFNHVPTYRELSHPSGDFGGHVGSPYRVIGRIWRLGDLLSAALCFACMFQVHVSKCGCMYTRRGSPRG